MISEIRRKADPTSLAGMKRFGIETTRALGLSVPQLRQMAKKIGKDHRLAGQLWSTRIHEARLLAGMIDDPEAVTKAQMEDWARDFDSWDIVDGTCGNLFDKTSFAIDKAYEWSSRQQEYVKRAGFVLMAELAVHDAKMADGAFLGFLPLIEREASDDRNFVKKAVNWALRQIGKRNENLNKAAIQTGRKIGSLDSKSAKWIASDALRELTSPAVLTRLQTGERSSRRLG